jgi:tRNA pseudouridine13 synthase
MARLRSEPEDFRVDEIPLYAASGEGGHTFVRVEKRLRNTEELARELARAAGARPADVGYAGRKDRVAVTTQWFSVPGLAPEAALALELHGARVIEAHRHPHKLRTGQLRGNRFEIVARVAETLPPRRFQRCNATDAEPLRPAAFRLGRRDLEQAWRLLRGEDRR